MYKRVPNKSVVLFTDKIYCYTDILEGMLQERGVDPWKDYMNNATEDKNEK